MGPVPFVSMISAVFSLIAVTVGFVFYAQMEIKDAKIDLFKEKMSYVERFAFDRVEKMLDSQERYIIEIMQTCKRNLIILKKMLVY